MNSIHIVDPIVGRRSIGPDCLPFVIAELSGNHNQSIDRARDIIRAAAGTGAQAVKLQTYTADTLTIPHDGPEFVVDHPLWGGRTLHELYQQAFTPWEWHAELIGLIRELGMIPLSTPFDATAVEFLEPFELALYKIASFENNDLPLIRQTASTGRPIVISSGMATRTELQEAVATCRAAGNENIVVLKCTSAYPARVGDANLATIVDMRRLLGVQIGLSDHTPGSDVAVAAITQGATVIEKHFTTSRADGGVDASFSLEPDEMTSLVSRVRAARAFMEGSPPADALDDFLRRNGQAAEAVGSVRYESDAERASMVFRRSLYVVQDVREGDRFTPENVRSIRPGYGLSPRYWDEVIERTATRDIAYGTALEREMVSGL